MKKLITGLLVLVVVAVVWMLTRGSTPLELPAPVSGEPQAGMVPVPAGAPTTVASRASTSAAEAPAARVALAEVALPPDTLARMRGRVVDARTLAPIAGAVLKLHAWPCNDERMEKHGKKVEWQDPAPITTAADGGFEFSFLPPPPYQFTLDVTHAGHAALSGRWSEIAESAVHDFGDVKMPGGAKVSGRVVDGDGNPRERVEVYLDREGRGEFAGLLPRTYTNTISGRGGAFEFRQDLSAGLWQVKVGAGSRLQGPKTFTVEPDARVASLEIVLLKESETDVIEGIVLDETERPAAGVDIDRQPSPSGQHWTLHSGRDGKFRLVREEHDPKEPVSFSVSHAIGFEPMQDARKFPWGTKDVVLHVRRALAIEVQALDAASAEPIEEFAVRCFRDPKSSGGWSSMDFRRRAEGKHPQGIAKVEGVRRGSNMLLIEPADRDRYAIGTPLHFQIGDDGAARQVVRVPRLATRTIEVVRKDGTPVKGTKVQSLLAVEERPITVQTRALAISELFQMGNMPQALLASEAQTDSAGRCTLRGPAEAKLCVAVLGPGHRALVVPDVVLAGETLRVEVASGGTLTGRISPKAVLDQFRAPTPGGRGARGPGLQLVDAADGSRRYPALGGSSLPIAEDGSFRIEGLDPGTWELSLSFSIDMGKGSAVGTSEHLATVADLREGQTREIELDVSALLFGELAAAVFVDGQPAADTDVRLQGSRPNGKGGETYLNAPPAHTDAQGRFVAKLGPGRYSATIGFPTPGARYPRQVQLTGSGEVTSGKTTDAVFELTRRVLRVLLLDAAGQPLPGRQIDIAGGGSFGGDRTDAMGALTLDPVLPGKLQFFLWPPELGTQDDRMRAMRDQKLTGAALQEKRIPLGEREVRADQKRVEITLRAPK